MDANSTQSMLACVASSQNIFLSFRKWKSFYDNDDETMAVSLWMTILNDYYEQWKSLPSPEQIQAIAPTYVINKLANLDMLVRGYVQGVCATSLSLYANISDKDDAEKVGKDLVVRFLRERIGTVYGRRMTQVGVDVAAINARMAADLATVDGSLATKFEGMFPSNWFPTARKARLSPIGIDFIDILLGGGLLDGEAVGHVAPVGQGKTTCVQQVCFSRCLNVVRERLVTAKTYNVPPDLSGLPVVYMFVYENVVNLLGNVISNAAMIPRMIAAQAQRDGTSESPVLQSAKNYSWRDYERHMFRDHFEECSLQESMGIPKELISWPKGELERFYDAIDIINAVWRIVDFSGHDRELLDYASEGIAGIDAYITAHQYSCGNPGVNFVAVDFVGAAADRACGGGNRSKDFKTDFIRTYPDVIGREVAAKYTCPVWCAHQSSPDENKKPGGSMPDPFAAEGSSMFLEYCAVGFASGKLNEKNRAIFKLGKSRRLAVGDVEPQIGYLDKEFARWLPSKDFTIFEGRIEDAKAVYSQSRGIPPSQGFSG
jgi:hypothetical protein